MVIMLVVFVYNAMSIMPMGLDILRDRNQLFRENSEGLIENTYTLRILNKTLQSRPISWMWRGCRNTSGSVRGK